MKLQPAGCPCQGTAVVSYLTDGFVMGASAPVHYHSNRWECWQMAQTFLEAGFRVEVVDYDNSDYVPPPDTRFVIDLHANLERFSERLPAGCITVHHVTGPHWLFANRAELERLYAMQQRRHITLAPRRQVTPSRATEVATFATMVGNDFTAETYAHVDKRIHRIPISSVTSADWSSERDYTACARRFLWVGSYGLVHKGLDLTLEAFARMPELHLTVCGPLQLETDFTGAYRHELSRLPNITAAGWVDAHGPEFLELLRTHAAVIFPSCSEGGAGGVISCLHGGVIPIVTREASVDLNDYGVLLPDVRIETIMEQVRMVANLPGNELRQRSRAAWETARRMHTREAFRENFRCFARDYLKLPLD